LYPLLISKEKGSGDEVLILTLNPYCFAVQVLLLNNMGLRNNISPKGEGLFIVLFRRNNSCFWGLGSPLLIFKEKGMGDEVLIVYLQNEK
jgi:hypothetical protein